MAAKITNLARNCICLSLNWGCNMPFIGFFSGSQNPNMSMSFISKSSLQRKSSIVRSEIQVSTAINFVNKKLRLNSSVCQSGHIQSFENFPKMKI